MTDILLCAVEVHNCVGNIVIVPITTIMFKSKHQIFSFRPQWTTTTTEKRNNNNNNSWPSLYVSIWMRIEALFMLLSHRELKITWICLRARERERERVYIHITDIKAKKKLNICRVDTGFSVFVEMNSQLKIFSRKRISLQSLLLHVVFNSLHMNLVIKLFRILLCFAMV